MEIKDKKIIVTGGAGYIGSILVPLLIDLGANITVCDNLMFGQPEPEFANRIRFIKKDLRDEMTIKEAIAGADAIIHLAAIVGEPACRKNPELAKEINVGITKKINELRGDIPLIYFSSTSIYGETTGAKCDENSLPTPETPYAIDKWEAEQAIHQTDNWIIFRPATVFGASARQRLDLLVNELTYGAVKEGKIKLFNPDLNRTFVHIYDLSQAVIWMLQNFDTLKNNAFNVGSDELNLSKRNIGEILEKKLDCELEIVNGDMDPDKRNFVVDYKKINSTGWVPKISLEIGINEMIDKFNNFTASAINYDTNYNI